MLDYQIQQQAMTPRERFLFERRSGIGGSDVAAIMGFSKWKTAHEVWQDKLGISNDDFDNDAMLWGRLLEPVIRQHYAERNNVEVFNLTAPLRNPKYPFLVANVDGAVKGARRGLEIKTARYMDDWGTEDTDEIPFAYLMQVNHYMLVAGVDEWDVAVLFSGSMYRQYRIIANKELQDRILSACSEFWQKYVMTGTPPPAQSYEDCTNRWGGSEVSGEVIAPSDVVMIARRVADLKVTNKELEDEIKSLSFAITETLQDRGNTLVDINGKVLATWKKPKDSFTLDKDLLKASFPKEYEACLTVKENTRRLIVKKE